jgi:hypothetical protein
MATSSAIARTSWGLEAGALGPPEYLPVKKDLVVKLDTVFHCDGSASVVAAEE